MDITNVYTFAYKIRDPIWAVYDAVPQDGKDFIYKCSNDFATVVLKAYGTWWGSDMTKTYDSYAQSPKYIGNQRPMVDVNIVQPIIVYLCDSDLATVGNNFKPDIGDRFLTPLVLKPMSDMVATKYNQVVNLLGPSSSSSTSSVLSTASIVPGGMWGWIIGGGLIFAMLASKKKGGSYARSY